MPTSAKLKEHKLKLISNKFSIEKDTLQMMVSKKEIDDTIVINSDSLEYNKCDVIRQNESKLATIHSKINQIIY